MSHLTRLLTAACLTVSHPFSGAAQQSGSALVQRLDSIAGAEVRANRSVGIVAAAVQGKNKLLLEAYGKADVDGNVPMTLATTIPIGSVTKQFTAVAVLQLRDQGKLGLDDDVRKWLPELNTGSSTVTIRHLLTHTAGITDLSGMQELRVLRMMYNPTLTRDSVYKIISRYPLVFPPGTMEVYSNSGFWLLGRVIEKASGVSYEEYIEKRILAPVGMSHSHNCSNGRPERAAGYTMRNAAFTREPDIVHTATYAAGAICSTAGDMITWLQALHGGKVLSPKSYAELIAPAKLADGTVVRYGLGTTVAEDSHGLRYIGHNGGGFGFSSEARWYPDAQLAVVVLTNSEPDQITKTTEAIAAAVLPPTRAAGEFTGDPSPLLGKYKGLAYSNMVVIVTRGPHGIMSSVNGQPSETLSWIEGWTFRKGDVLLTFRAGASTDQAAELRFDTGGDHYILERVTATAATMSAPLSAFEGTYEGQQPEATVTIAVENDTLRVLPSSGGKGNLIPESGTTFYNGREGAPRTVTFNLGPDGKAISMTLKGPGTERTLKKLR
jgi:CubicO group peptidase (beta-lactamase class C family)